MKKPTSFTCRQPNCGEVFPTMSKMRSHQYQAHPSLYERMKKACRTAAKRRSAESVSPDKAQPDIFTVFQQQVSLSEAIAALEIKRDAMSEIIAELKRMHR